RAQKRSFGAAQAEAGKAGAGPETGFRKLAILLQPGACSQEIAVFCIKTLPDPRKPLNSLVLRNNLLHPELEALRNSWGRSASIYLGAIHRLAISYLLCFSAGGTVRRFSFPVRLCYP